MNVLLDETTTLLREAVRQFAKQHIEPIAAQIDASTAFPSHLWPLMGEMGLLGITVDEAYGGSHMGYLAHVVAMEEISRASGSVGLSYGAHSNLCVNQISLNGSSSQKKRYLPDLISGKAMGALAMSEVGSGSDVMSMTLSATAKNDGYVLNGQKMWITNGPQANVLVVYAKTTKHDNSKAITAFLVEKDTQGFHTAQKLDKLGMRGSDTCELVFEECWVPKENILGELNQGAKVLMSGLNYERLILAAGPLGIMQACVDLVVPYVQQRKQFGKKLCDFQLIQAKCADMYVALHSSRAYLYALAQQVDKGMGLKNEEAAAVILYISEQATKVALQTIQCLGGNGYTNEYPAGRYLRDAKLYEIGAGTSEIRRLIIGKAMTK